MKHFSQPEILSADLFKNPPSQYRGAPFWSWNTKLDFPHHLQQIEVLKAMGMGGVTIHARTGLATPYLGSEFMDDVRASVEKADAEGMWVGLYDEDRWPSGFAGGLVTHDPRYRAKHLLFTCDPENKRARDAVMTSKAAANRTDDGVLLARYHVVLRDGVLSHYRRLFDSDEVPGDGCVWYAFLETSLPSPWFNNQTYVDTLNKAAIERFIEVTHERYKSVVGDYFGSVIPSIFTDEPQFTHKQPFSFADSTDDAFMPFTSDFFETYHAAYGDYLEDQLPELFWELPHGQPSLARYRYHDHLTERFAQAFSDTIGQWCEANGIALTGHMMQEESLQAQTGAVGEVMRGLRAFHLPGIDILCDRREYTTAKQAQSIAHQYDRAGVMSELYGVTNWDFDFLGHKAQGDWQAALGVTMRVHHLAWVSMQGEAKRDYPASIGYQSPWWQEYSLIEDHFARLNTALTCGRALVRVGVLHPIESAWLAFGPLEQTQTEREERDRAFEDITRWLLFGLIDFDYISESLLPSLAKSDQSAPFRVGAAHYDAIVVPGIRTIRSTTLDRLETFRTAGGLVIFAGEIPSLVDAHPSTRAQEFVQRWTQVGLTPGQLLEALAPVREIEIRLSNGSPADAFLHQIRTDGDARYVFICNTDKVEDRPQTQIRLSGDWKITQMDTLTGEQSQIPVEYRAGKTWLIWDFPAHGSLLLRLDPGRQAFLEYTRSGGSISRSALAEIADPVPISLSEPNVLVMDIASYQLDDEDWQPAEEILRVDNNIRRQLGYPLRMEALAQPWIDAAAPTFPHTLSLAFTIEASISVSAPLLAIECADQITLTLDGQSIPAPINGWWVDEAIQTVTLPSIAAGSHQLIVQMPYGPRANPEWCYLLGDFGVEVSGRYARLTPPVRTLAFGDWTRQGLPFYAGNVIYRCTVKGTDEALTLHVPKFRAPLLSVAVDGVPTGKIAFAPFQLALDALSKSDHELAITAYGNRINAFGTLHNNNDRTTWFGPNAWRTVGDDWSYVYQIKPMGLLTAPQLWRR